jgi:hypothetical protein
MLFPNHWLSFPNRQTAFCDQHHFADFDQRRLVVFTDYAERTGYIDSQDHVQTTHPQPIGRDEFCLLRFQWPLHQFHRGFTR